MLAVYSCRDFLIDFFCLHHMNCIISFCAFIQRLTFANRIESLRLICRNIRVLGFFLLAAFGLLIFVNDLVLFLHFLRQGLIINLFETTVAKESEHKHSN